AGGAVRTARVPAPVPRELPRVLARAAAAGGRASAGARVPVVRVRELGGRGRGGGGGAGAAVRVRGVPDRPLAGVFGRAVAGRGGREPGRGGVPGAVRRAGVHLGDARTGGGWVGRIRGGLAWPAGAGDPRRTGPRCENANGDHGRAVDAGERGEGDVPPRPRGRAIPVLREARRGARDDREVDRYHRVTTRSLHPGRLQLPGVLHITNPDG